MKTTLTMPSFSTTMQTGTLVRWFVAEGDSIAPGDLLAEVETDKASLDIEAETSGIIHRILVPAGTRDVPVDTPLADLAPPETAQETAGPDRSARPSRPAPSGPASNGAPTLREGLNSALATALAQDESVVLLGAGIGADEGAYRVTQGLYARFGPDRVMDVTAPPEALIGLAIGAGHAGMRPVAELESWAQALPALHLIVEAGGSAARTNGALACPIVLRGPHGYAGQAGPTLSIDVAAFLSHVPGLTVISAFAGADAETLLAEAIAAPGPVAVLESALLYSASCPVPMVDTGPLPLGRARRWRAGNAVSLISHGSAMPATLTAAETLSGTHGIECAVVELRSLRPLDSETIIGSVQETGRCVVVCDGWPQGAVADQVAAVIARGAFRAPVACVTAEDTAIPYAEALEAAHRPSAQRVVDAVLRIAAD